MRLGLYTGRGYGELIRERFGLGWAWLSVAGWRRRRSARWSPNSPAWRASENSTACRAELTLPLAAAALLAVVATGSYRRVERIAIVIGLFELAFFAVAWAAHPNLAILAKDAVDLPLGDHAFMYMVAAVIGAVFNPWMIFYQQSADRRQKASARLTSPPPAGIPRSARC